MTYSQTKETYAATVQSLQTALLNKLSALRPLNSSCSQCDAQGQNKGQDETQEKIQGSVKELLTAPDHPGCSYTPWRKAALRFLEVDTGQKILAQLNHIQEERNRYPCHQCGVCCRLGSSEYSWDELTQQAAEGNSFAQEFTRVFLPYASEEVARATFPSVVDAMIRHSNHDPIYFYHCPYVGEDNRCTLFGSPKRPSLCAAYPETPLSFIYEHCGWKPWQDDQHAAALNAHATLALAQQWVTEIKQSLSR